MAMIIRRIATGLFHGHWSLLTTINGGLAGMVKIFLNTLYFVTIDDSYFIVVLAGSSNSRRSGLKL